MGMSEAVALYFKNYFQIPWTFAPRRILVATTRTHADPDRGKFDCCHILRLR